MLKYALFSCGLRHCAALSVVVTEILEENLASQ